MQLIFPELLSAFSGAFFAFLFILLIDYIRSRVKKRRLFTILHQVRSDVQMQKHRIGLDIVHLLNTHELQSQTFIPFHIDAIQTLHREITHLFKLNVNKAIHMIFFSLESAEESIEQIHYLTKMSLESGITMYGGKLIIYQVEMLYMDTLRSLFMVLDQLDMFFSKQYEQILAQSYDEKKYKDEVRNYVDAL